MTLLPRSGQYWYYPNWLDFHLNICRPSIIYVATTWISGQTKQTKKTVNKSGGTRLYFQIPWVFLIDGIFLKQGRLSNAACNLCGTFLKQYADKISFSQLQTVLPLISNHKNHPKSTSKALQKPKMKVKNCFQWPIPFETPAIGGASVTIKEIVQEYFLPLWSR